MSFAEWSVSFYIHYKENSFHRHTMKTVEPLKENPLELNYYYGIQILPSS